MVFGAVTATVPVPDPAITLFGRRISVPDTHPEPDVVAVVPQPGNPDSFHDLTDDGVTVINNIALVSEPDNHGKLAKGSIDVTPVEDDIAVLISNDTQDVKDEEYSIGNNSTLCVNNDQSSQQKGFKKPEKILPCPRCNSLDTKFCYYNNYNVNQPRYYCKNCERYWTDGGTMRNVPVGAGRRKNKHIANHHQIPCASSEGMSPPGNNVSLPPPGQVHSSCTPHGSNVMVLKIQTKEPHLQTKADSLIRENSKVEQSSSTPSECGRNSFASVTVTDYTRNKSTDVSEVEQNVAACAEVASVHPAQCYPGNQWTFLRSPGWNNTAFAAVGCTSDIVCGESGSLNVIPWNPTSFVSSSAFVPPTFPFSFIPASFWGCVTSWPAGVWNAPLGSYNDPSSLSSSSSSLASPTNNEHSSDQSLKLGKRSRDEVSQVEDKAAASLWFPKTLRIDDPDQAAKSSIWATLGITHDQSKPVKKGTMFKCFPSKTERKIPRPDASEFLDANPAALSRSQAFQESS